MDLLHEALVNELNLTLKEWDRLNEIANQNHFVDRGKLDWLRVKITDLCARLDKCPPFFYPSGHDTTKHGG